MGHFTFWISLSLKPKTETKRRNFGPSPEFRLTNRRSGEINQYAVIGDSSPISPYFSIFELPKK